MLERLKKLEKLSGGTLWRNSLEKIYLDKNPFAPFSPAIRDWITMLKNKKCYVTL
jgi:hypothetical protein